jgi:CRP-like cAMP-binding protein
LSQDGQKILLGELTEGAIFGEMALIDNKPRSATVEAFSPCRLAFISKEAFQRLVQTRSELAFHLTGYICLSLFRRILRLDRLYSDIKQQIRSG